MRLRRVFAGNGYVAAVGPAGEGESLGVVIGVGLILDDRRRPCGDGGVEVERPARAVCAGDKIAGEGIVVGEAIGRWLVIDGLGNRISAVVGDRDGDIGGVRREIRPAA